MRSEFDFRVVGDGRSAVARYANNSNYRNDSLIRKESKDYALELCNQHFDRFIVCVSSVVVDEIKRIIKTSEITKYDEPNIQWSFLNIANPI
jgi:protein mago nashi